MAYFPLIGMVLGAILVASDKLLLMVFPIEVVSALLLVVLFFTNNGLHLDGFADTVDGLYGGNTPQERLKIMRDSAAGAIGVVAVVLLLMLKYVSIKSIPPEMRSAVLFMMPVAGRWAMVPLASLSPYARISEGLGKAFAANSRSTLLIATAIAAIAAAFTLGTRGIVALVVVLLFTSFQARYFRRRLGGITGDVFGFNCESSEVIFLLIFIASYSGDIEWLRDYLLL